MMPAADSTLAAALPHCGARTNPRFSIRKKENRYEQINSPDDKSS
jgi:hypothetical protein